MRIAIDAANLRQGGGVTHLVQLLAAADPPASGVERVVVWGAPELLNELPIRPWLTREAPEGLDSAVGRARWQRWTLARMAAGRVELLFVPGGTYLGRFRPFVTMFRNMLPFDSAELRRQDSARFRVKMRLLRAAQTTTFRRANGLIFLNEYARDVIVDGVGRIRGRTAVIPHGLDPRFFAAPRDQAPLAAYSDARPFRWLYVSAIYDYKRPWNVAEAAAQLRSAGVPVAVEFLGPAFPVSMERLRQTIDRLDPNRAFLTVAPSVPHSELARHYATADAFVFASTCENMPNSLLEAMAAGLPIASSNRPPMPAILQDGGVYFDPERPVSIASALDALMRDPARRAQVAARAHDLARPYDWTRAARDTFDFLASTSAS
jgi:glycosyltransferase involved in cell wall biosynthesis